MSSPDLDHRVETELREVVKLLEAAEQIADGLVAVCDHAYDHDQRSSHALAAANQCAVTLRDQREIAEERLDAWRDVRTLPRRSRS